MASVWTQELVTLSPTTFLVREDDLWYYDLYLKTQIQLFQETRKSMEHRPIAFRFQPGETVLVLVTNELALMESRTRGYWKANEYDVIVPPGNGRMRVREENLAKVPREKWIRALESMAGIDKMPSMIKDAVHRSPPLEKASGKEK